MNSDFKISIPKPCHENWNAMTPDEQGRFCGVCAKSVIDFTGMNDTQVKTFFSENAGKKICGRFREEQLDEKFIFKISNASIYQKRSFYEAFMIALFVVMGTTLFSCKNFNGQEMGEVAIEQDSTALSKQDSISENGFMLGKPAVMSEEVLPPPPQPKVRGVKFKEKEEEIKTTTGLVLPEIIEDSTKVK